MRLVCRNYRSRDRRWKLDNTTLPSPRVTALGRAVTPRRRRSDDCNDSIIYLPTIPPPSLRFPFDRVKMPLAQTKPMSNLARLPRIYPCLPLTFHLHHVHCSDLFTLIALRRLFPIARGVGTKIWPMKPVGYSGHHVLRTPYFASCSVCSLSMTGPVIGEHSKKVQRRI